LSAERTEDATPKRKQEARRQGQVAKSADVNAAAVLFASTAALIMFGPKLVAQMEDVLREGIERAGTPDAASAEGIADLTMWGVKSLTLAAGPIMLTVLAAGVLANVAQVGLRLTPVAMKPSLSKINPLQGLKRLFGKNAAVEAGKAIAKSVLIGFAAYLALKPRIEDIVGLTGASPGQFLSLLAVAMRDLALRVGGALALIAVADWAWQRRRHKTGMKMTKEEVRQESKQSDLPPEVKRKMKMRQFELSRSRMLAEVLTADVVVVNPTHYAAALRYDGSTAAPQLVAKGVDHLAAAIREKAREARVPIVANPPLARTLYAEVELNAQIPEGMFTTVAEVLAFVYRTAGRRRRTLKQNRTRPMKTRHAVG
jgi:flagellar biosynthetic protein FlhB